MPSIYDSLGSYLSRQPPGSTTLSFKQIETILGRSLPPSARALRNWWANHLGNTQARAWLHVGWKVEEIRLSSEVVTFAKENGSPASPRADSRSASFSPSQPFTNRVRLRDMLRACNEYIWWIDKDFDARGLEELALPQISEPSRVKQIHILSRETAFTPSTRNDFFAFQREVRTKGIYTEWRLLDRRDERDIHDRYILAANICYSVPPLNAMREGQYAQANECHERPPFEEWWQRARRAT